VHAPSLAQALIGALLLGSALAAGWASRADVPYSDAFPKRVLVQHLHVLRPDGRVQVAPALPRLHGIQPRLTRPKPTRLGNVLTSVAVKTS
jgi:hypothetical protein